MICRICRSTKARRFLDLGFHPPSDAFLSLDELNEPETYYPLEVFVCNSCGLVQLGYVVPPQILFQRDYPYVSSTTRTGREHFYSLAKEAVLRFGISPDDLVVDIGSNVGVLLQGFKAQGVRNVLGIDPAENVCQIAREAGIETVSGFFSEGLAHEVVKSKGRAKVITGTNVMAHIDDHHATVRGLQILLAEKGVFIFEAPYLINLIDNLEYDTIYHEHLSYLSVKPISRLFSQFGMEVFDVKEVEIHGGSLRYFVAGEGDYPTSDYVSRLIELEDGYGVDRLTGFAEAVQDNRARLTWLLKGIKHEGKRIVGVSAPAKGMTLLNYCRIGTETLDFITEKAPLKIGKYTPGAHIPIFPDSELVRQMPDFALLLAWNFADEIMKNLDSYKKAGGKFIIPIPEPHIIG